MDRSESPSSPRVPPFSLVEFGDLVSAALDTPDPLLSFNTSPFFSKLHPGENAASGEQSIGRFRQVLQKFKKHATAFARRSAARSTEEVRPSSPEYRIPELSLSVSWCGASGDDFVPYLPLVAQYERSSPYQRPISTYSSTPSLPSQCSTRSLYANSNSSYCSFNPPSPGASSCSSGYTSSESHYPTTPLRTVSEESCSCWSADSADWDDCPTDPFRKTGVHVVCSPSFTPTFPSNARPLRRRGLLCLPPSQPPPSCPLPPAPLSHRRPPRLMLQDPRTRTVSSTTLLDAFPTPPAHTPTRTPPVTPKRRYRASGLISPPPQDPRSPRTPSAATSSSARVPAPL
ncbi:hypothetical protein C8J57DRAFT_1339150, partial [Mycena rebaudengoi]